MTDIRREGARWTNTADVHCQDKWVANKFKLFTDFSLKDIEIEIEWVETIHDSSASTSTTLVFVLFLEEFDKYELN